MNNTDHASFGSHKDFLLRNKTEEKTSESIKDGKNRILEKGTSAVFLFTWEFSLISYIHDSVWNVKSVVSENFPEFTIL